MRWCRLYSEFATDPKVQIMPEAMQRRLIMLFCFQADGCLEAMDDETLGFAMHLNAAELQKTKELFVKKGFLEPGTWIPRNWDKRQRSSDTSNERVSRYRERTKRESNGTVTLQKLKQTVTSNTSPLAPPRNRDRVRIPETETETDKDKDPPIPRRGQVVESLSSEDEFPEYPDPLTTIVTVQSGDHSIPETKAREIWGHLRRNWESERLCFGFYEQQRWCSVEGWLYAIKTAVTQGSRPNHIKFLQKIGMEFDVNGPKRVKPLTKGDVGEVPYKPTNLAEDGSSKRYGFIREGD